MVDSGRLDAFASDTWQYTADLCLGSPLLLPVRTDKLSEESTDVGSKSKYTLSLTLITLPRGCKGGWIWCVRRATRGGGNLDVGGHLQGGVDLDRQTGFDGGAIFVRLRVCWFGEVIEMLPSRCSPRSESSTL